MKKIFKNFFIKKRALYLLYIPLHLLIKILRLFESKSSNKIECINCNKVLNNFEVCECGSIRFVINSSKYSNKLGGIKCNCNKGVLENICHYDCDDGFEEEYRCTNCRNTITIFEYCPH